MNYFRPRSFFFQLHSWILDAKCRYAREHIYYRYLCQTVMEGGILCGCEWEFSTVCCRGLETSVTLDCCGVFVRGNCNNGGLMVPKSKKKEDRIGEGEPFRERTLSV
jgi:hypothetical protein